MPGAVIVADQPTGAGAGVPGVSRNDLWLSQQVNLSVGVGGNTSYEWIILDKPPGSGASLSSTNTATSSFTPDVVGTYRVRLITNGGGPGNVQIKVFRVRYTSTGALASRGWAMPAKGEFGIEENNYASNVRGYDEAWRFIVDDLQPWAGGLKVYEDGSLIGQRRNVNFIGDFAVTDNNAQDRIDVAFKIGVQDDGTIIGARRYLNFKGDVIVTDDNVNDRIDVEIRLGVKDEGGVIGAFNKMNFTGDLITASDAGGGELLLTYVTPVLIHSLVFSTEVSIATTTYNRQGARVIDLSKYPATKGSLTRKIRLHVVLENSIHSALFYAEARLLDITHAVAVGGTTLANNLLPDRSVPTEFVSGDLTVGNAAGNIRNDVPTLYGLQFRGVGTMGGSDRVMLGGAYLAISYE